MFAILQLRDSVIIPNHLLSAPLKETVTRLLKEKYESMVNSELGYVIMVMDASVDQSNKINSSEGTIYNDVDFSVLTFYPRLQEIVEGELVEITDFGGFVRIGPTDALIHISQIADELVRADVKGGMIVAEGGKKIKLGSTIRARITSVSHLKIGQIGLSCRGSSLGPRDWIKSKKVSLCDHCNKKLGLRFRCRSCRGNFCDDHRLPENHDCRTRSRKLR